VRAQRKTFARLAGRRPVGQDSRAARKVAVEETGGGAEAALRGVERLWPFGGPKRWALELFFEKLAANAPSDQGGGFATGPGGLGHVAITTRKPEAMIAFWRERFDAFYQ
jgi:hypothetical protein